MSVSLLTNHSATVSANNLSSVSAQLQRSLNRLSSGSKIVNPSDDAGGLAVSTKMGAAIKRQAAASNNISNAMSYLQTQDGAMNSATAILSRMGELKTLSQDVTKNSSDKANYNTEFTALQEQLSALAEEKFNGISLFSSSTLSVKTAVDGSSTAVDVGGVDLLGKSSALFETFNDPLTDGSAFTTDKIGGIGGGVSITGGQIQLDGGTGAIVSAETNDTFTGPLEISFDMTQNGVTGALFQASYDGTSFFTRANESGTESIRMTYDGSQIDVYVDGESEPSTTITGVSGLAGKLKFEGIGGVGGIQQISNLSVSSTNPAGEISDSTTAGSLDALSLSTITSAIEDVATYRAQNGAQQSRLQFARDQLTVNQSNLEAARSRITDVDVAEESTQLARLNVLQQAGSSMLSQANQSQQIALRLLG